MGEEGWGYEVELWLFLAWFLLVMSLGFFSDYGFCVVICSLLVFCFDRGLCNEFSVICFLSFCSWFVYCLLPFVLWNSSFVIFKIRWKNGGKYLRFELFWNAELLRFECSFLSYWFYEKFRLYDAGFLACSVG